MRYLLTALAFFWCGVAIAQIEVPPQSPPFAPIVATLKTDLPAGAKIRGGWELSTGQYLPGPDGSLHIWAPPGSHTLRASGIWVLTKDVTLDGQIVPVLVDFGQYDYSAVFSVGVPDPDPGPEPGPDPTPPPAAAWGMIVEETSDRTPQQARLWNELRQKLPVHKLLIVDEDNTALQLKTALQAVRESGVELPVLVTLDADGRVLAIKPAPTTVQGVMEAIGVSQS